MSGNRRTISTIIYSLHFRAWSQTKELGCSWPDLRFLALVFHLFVSFFCLTTGTTWRTAVWTRGWTLGKDTRRITVWTWPVRTAVKAPAKTETVTGTTIASHLGAVVGVVAAGEAAASTETEGADVATLAPGPPRYENLLPSYHPPPPPPLPPNRMGHYHWCLANA